MKKIASIVLSCIIILNLVVPVNAGVDAQKIVSKSVNPVITGSQKEGVLQSNEPSRSTVAEAKSSNYLNKDNTNGNINNNKLWTMTWNDEFSGNKIDTSKWTYDIGNWIVDESGTGVASGWGNNEKEYYTNSSDNSYVKAGKLVIEAKKEVTTDQFGTYDYTSAKLKTKGLFSQTYGRYEIKAKFPVGKGLWPAIWMLPEDDAYGGWAASGEIDIAEGWGSKPNEIGGTLHYGGVWPNNKYTGKTYTFSSNTSVNEFHEYALEWEPGEIRWYIDGVLYQTQNNWYNKDSNGEKYAFPAPFDQDFFMILNLAVGGNFDGEPTVDTQFPSKMEVDYVRVYELTGRDYMTPSEPSTQSEPLPSGAKVPTEDGNLLTDGSFNQPIQNNFDGSLDFSDKWNLVTIGDFGGSATQSIETLDGANFAKVDITSGGNQNYSVQLIQTTTIGKGRYYKVSFDSKSTTDRNINMKVGGGADVGYAVYSDNYTLGLTSSMQHFEKTFQMSGDTNLNTRLELNLGLNTNPVWIGNVRLEEVNAPAKDYNATKVPLADGNGVYNSAFDKESINRMAYWNFSVKSTATATGTVAENTREFYANILNGGSESDLITLDQQGIQLEKNSDYKLAFDARTTDVRDIKVALLSKDGSFSYLESSVVALDTSMKTYEIDFRMNEETDLESQLVFELGGNDADVYIDAVSLKQTSIDYSSIDVYPLKNGDFSNGLTAWSNYIDWSAGAIISNENGEAKVAIDHVGPQTWGIQLYQGTFDFSNKVDYIVAFDVKSTVDRNLEIVIDNAGYYRYLSKTVAATNDYTHYEYTLRVPADDTVSLKFLLGKTDADVPDTAHDLFIDNVVCQVKNAPPVIDNPSIDSYPLKNGDFSTGLTAWANYIDWSAGAIISNENDQAKVAIDHVGPQTWGIQLYQGTFDFSNKVDYVVAFDVKSTVDRNLEIVIDNAGYYRYLSKTVTATSEYTHYEYTLRIPADDKVSLKFLLGKTDADVPDTAHDIFIDNVVCEVIDIYPLENGNFTDGLTSWGTYIDWTAGAVISNENNQAKVAIDHVGPQTWGIQLFQGTFDFSNKVDYIVAFDVKSTVNRNLEIVIENAGYYRYLSKTVTATSEYTHYEYTLRIPAEDRVFLKFLLGKTDVDVPDTEHDIFIDNVVCEVKVSSMEN